MQSEPTATPETTTRKCLTAFDPEKPLARAPHVVPLCESGVWRLVALDKKRRKKPVACGMVAFVGVHVDAEEMLKRLSETAGPPTDREGALAGFRQYIAELAKLKIGQACRIDETSGPDDLRLIVFRYDRPSRPLP